MKALVQNLIDDKISPDEFTKRLQIELKSSPQPYLVPFLEVSINCVLERSVLQPDFKLEFLPLQKSLPLLRLTMMQQTPGGQVPVAVAQAALRVSTLNADVKPPSSPRPKPPAKPTKSTVKPIKGVCKVLKYVGFFKSSRINSTFLCCDCIQNVTELIE